MGEPVRFIRRWFEPYPGYPFARMEEVPVEPSKELLDQGIARNPVGPADANEPMRAVHRRVPRR
jgi:hypothetical protein